MEKNDETMEAVKKILSGRIEGDMIYRSLKSKEEYHADGMALLKKRFHQNRKDIDEDSRWETYAAENSRKLMSYVNGARISARRRQLQQEVKARTAEAVIADRLKGVPVRYRITMGYNHVNISVKLNDEMQATFCIRLKKLEEELDKMLKAVGELKQTVDEFGGVLRVDSMNRWNRW